MMHVRSATPRDCAWARQQMSLRLDSELSEFEDALLEAHLAACGACRAFGADVEGITGALRAAPLEQPVVPLQLPRRQRRRVSSLGSLSAAASIAAIVLSGFVGLHLSRARTSGSALRPTHEFTALMEQQLNRLGSVGRESAPRTPPGVVAAEQLTVVRGAVRTTAPSRLNPAQFPERTFGKNEGR